MAANKEQVLFWYSFCAVFLQAKGQEFCRSLNYWCKEGHCCGRGKCCTYYYELWWFWFVWLAIAVAGICCFYQKKIKPERIGRRFVRVQIGGDANSDRQRAEQTDSVDPDKIFHLPTYQEIRDLSKDPPAYTQLYGANGILLETSLHSPCDISTGKPVEDPPDYNITGSENIAPPSYNSQDGSTVPDYNSPDGSFKPGYNLCANQDNAISCNIVQYGSVTPPPQYSPPSCHRTGSHGAASSTSDQKNNIPKEHNDSSRCEKTSGDSEMTHDKQEDGMEASGFWGQGNSENDFNESRSSRKVNTSDDLDVSDENQAEGNCSGSRDPARKWSSRPLNVSLQAGLLANEEGEECNHNE